MLEQLLKDGMLDKDGKGKLQLTPRSINKMQRRALMEVFANLRQGNREGHEKITPGLGGDRIEGTKPYEYGDPVSELDLHQTLHNALTRHGLPQKGSGVRVQGSGQKASSLNPEPRTLNPAPPYGASFSRHQADHFVTRRRANLSRSRSRRPSAIRPGIWGQRSRSIRPRSSTKGSK